jgi:hypothetical protein
MVDFILIGWWNKLLSPDLWSDPKKTHPSTWRSFPSASTGREESSAVNHAAEFSKRPEAAGGGEARAT